MKNIIRGKEFQVKQTSSKYFYWSPKNGRWLPISKSKVIVN